MADPTIDATVGGASANCYITRANAQTYFNGRLDVAAWDGASDADKDRALIMATVRLEQEEWRGSKVDVAQALKWPRYSTYNDNGDVYDSDDIPDVVDDACCEMALAILKDPTIMSDSGLEAFKRVGVGGGAVAVEPRASRKAGALPQQVVRLLRTVRVGSGGISGTVSRG
jgi:hypothetical protein